jgi:hypothetical protein
MWKKLEATYNEVFTINRGRLLACMKAGWVCIMVDIPRNKVIAAAPCLDLLDYM